MFVAEFVDSKDNFDRFVAGNFKEKPLPQTLTVGVLSHKQPVLSLMDSQSSLQIATLKFTVELKITLK